MIENIVILLIANTLVPMIPIPPQILLPLPLTHLLIIQPTAYDHMNLTRLHTKQQFKKSFRQALKILHPDRGGSQQTFAKIKNLKQIMQSQYNYYDILNITDADLAFNQPLKNVVYMKQLVYYVSTGIFYFIALLYSITFTVDDDIRPARKYLILFIIIFGSYELFIHMHSQYTTIFDYFFPKLPIFIQKILLKNILSIIIAIIRTKFLRKNTQEKILIQDLLKQDWQDFKYKQILQKINQIYYKKLLKKQQNNKSFLTKVRGWVSTGVSIFILILVARGFFIPNQNQSQGLNDL